MAKRKASGRSKAASTRKKATSTRKATSRPAAKRATVKKAAKRMGKRATARKAAPKPARKRLAARSRTATGTRSARPAAKAKKTAGKNARSTAKRRRRDVTIPSPPSSLNMNRRGSAARTGRDEMAEERADHATMTPNITGGDVDANVGDAYFTGDEAPGGDNTTPDQDIVDDIGRALGVEYQDNEELRGSDKVADRDKHRWELDPASSEDYRDRK
jgi:hypothetical protein